MSEPAWTRVVRDEAMSEWRVICPVHGELARYRNFWTASRDARQHDGNCGPGKKQALNQERGVA